MIGPFTGEYRFLSNFYPAAIHLPVTWEPARSVEHAYQAMKGQGKIVRDWILASPNPGTAKKRGRKAVLPPDWEEKKLGYMEFFLRLKFDDPVLRARLLATKPEELVEINHWGDTYWGVCNGSGQNHLGRLLMKVRDEL